MKINNFGVSGINPYRQNAAKIAKTESTVGKKTDQVEISSAAKELQQASTVTGPRQEKIEALKAQIQNGTYEVNPDDLAKSIYNYYFQK